MTLKVKKITGGYSSTNIINKINFEVNSGELAALIGLNGSGKTTIINHIVGLLHAKKGDIYFNKFNINVDTERYHHNLAYIPEIPVVYKNLTLLEHIQVTIAAYNLNIIKANRMAQKLLKIFHLNNKENWFPQDFSKGMRQKVMIVCALLSKAPLLIIDEPFIGLDPLAKYDLIKIIKQRKNKGSTILLSTHTLEGIFNLVDKFLLLDRGTLRAKGNFKQILSQFKGSRNLNDIYFKLGQEIENSKNE